MYIKGLGDGAKRHRSLVDTVFYGSKIGAADAAREHGMFGERVLGRFRALVRSAFHGSRKFTASHLPVIDACDAARVPRAYYLCLHLAVLNHTIVGKTERSGGNHIRVPVLILVHAVLIGGDKQAVADREVRNFCVLLQYHKEGTQPAVVRRAVPYQSMAVPVKMPVIVRNRPICIFGRRLVPVLPPLRVIQNQVVCKADIGMRIHLFGNKPHEILFRGQQIVAVRILRRRLAKFPFHTARIR